MKRIILSLLLLFSCEENKGDKIANIEVTMLRIPYIPLNSYIWETPTYMYGTLESDNFDVEGMVVNWFSDMYWDENDSSGYYKLLCGRCDEAVWYDMDGTTDTTTIDINELRWVTQRSSVTDSLGNFYNVLTPVTTMIGHNEYGSWMWLWWSIEGTVIDSQEIYLMY